VEDGDFEDIFWIFSDNFQRVGIMSQVQDGKIEEFYKCLIWAVSASIIAL
jgi:hypothetical protein